MDARDRAPIRAQFQAFDSLEEFEFHAALGQQLVKWRDHDVAHAGPHFVEHVTAIHEANAKCAAERHAGGEVRPFKIAALIGKAAVVEGAEGRGCKGRVGGPVLTQPRAEIPVVDGSKPLAK